MNLATATKADLQAEVRRLQRSLQRSNAKVAALDKSLGSVKTRNKTLVTSLSEAKANLIDLETSLVEAHNREKATAEILTVISSAPSDTKPVFEAILGNALRLCSAHMGQLYVYDGEKLRNVAHRGTTPAYLRFVEERGPFRPVSSAIWKRVISQRRPVHLADLTRSSQYRNRLPGVVALVELNEARTHVAVPLLNRGRVVGVIAIYRSQVQPFLQKQIDLLATFASQAVIAIENVRLFKELQARNAELTDALEQQTATSEILRIISSSPTDTQPVFEAIVRSGARLFGDGVVSLRLVKGEQSVIVASTQPLVEAGVTAPFHLNDHGWPAVQAVLRREVVQIPDVLAADRVSEEARRRAASRGFRAIVCAPMLRKGEAVGTINVTRRIPGTFGDKQVALLKTFADQAVIAIENARLFNETKEALEKQSATAEILKVISTSPTDTTPVFDTILQKAALLCDSTLGGLGIYDGENFQIVAANAGNPEVEKAALQRGPYTPNPGGFLSRALKDGHPYQIADLRSSDGYRNRRPYQTLLVEDAGIRSYLFVPMLKKGRAVGGIALYRSQVRPFTEDEIALLRTFSDQAVIAIENVRLFKELQARNAEVTEALEQQTATAEILRVISNSPTDTQPVFDAILRNACHLCDAPMAALQLHDGAALRRVANRGFPPAYFKWVADEGYKTTPQGAVLQMAETGRPVHILDRRESPGYLRRQPSIVALVELAGVRTFLTVPMKKEERVIGALAVMRSEVRAFTQKEIDLLTTFADQAVIAIENVRLFKELEARNAEITEALERQTATAHILEIISRSPTDIQTVLDAVASSAGRLCEANDAVIYRVDGDVMHVAAHIGHLPTAEARPVHAKSVVAQAIRERRTIHVHDVSDPRHLEEYPDAVSAIRRAYKTILVAPLIREDFSIGAVIVRRDNEVRPFSDKQVALLETFAAQAVIAIENVRLFKELQAQTEALSRSVNQLTALGEIGQAISSTLDLETVLQTIVSRARLLTGHSGSIYEYDQGAGVFRIQAAENMEEEVIRAIRRSPIALGDGIVGRTGFTQEPTQVADILEPGFESGRKELLIRSGYRAMLAVPLLREGQLLGILLVSRKTPGAFPAETVEILKTFATQSALAIQNARLFREIAEKGRQLEIANRHKSEFLANMSHELRTPLNAVIGFSEVLQQGMVGALNEKQNEYLNYIHTSGSHLLSLINDILDLAKVEAGRMELDVTSFSVPMAIDNAITLVRERATRHGLTLESTLDPAVAEVDADERKFKQILLNLLSNAVKFTAEGGQITVAARAINATVEVSVTDTGVGIAPEDCEAVFEEFRQVGQDAERKAQGTGLGLALTKKFIELHGGRIWLTSAPGKGSTFSFTLPIHQPEVQATA